MDMQKALKAITEWMKEEGVNQKELAGRTGYSQAMMSLVFSYRRNPTVEFIGDVAEALGHSREEILRIADYLPYDKERDAQRDRIMHWIETLPGPARESVESYIHFLAEKERKKKQKNSSDKNHK